MEFDRVPRWRVWLPNNAEGDGQSLALVDSLLAALLALSTLVLTSSSLLKVIRGRTGRIAVGIRAVARGTKEIDVPVVQRWDLTAVWGGIIVCATRNQWRGVLELD